MWHQFTCNPKANVTLHACHRDTVQISKTVQLACSVRPQVSCMLISQRQTEFAWTRLISLGRVTLAQARAMYRIDKGNKGFLSSLLSLVNDILE
jgi:hypothetical protein